VADDGGDEMVPMLGLYYDLDDARTDPLKHLYLTDASPCTVYPCTAFTLLITYLYYKLAGF